MIIINADDLGRNRRATDNIISCYVKGSITSASAMVFMDDSRRSSELALENKMDIGLHINFTEKFTGELRSDFLEKHHAKIAGFLSKNKYALLFYNPSLIKCFEYVYKSQYEEFLRVYNQQPAHINGHQHMHLSTNMVLHNVIPSGNKVRRNFSFTHTEKSSLNRLYRHIVNKKLLKRHISTDYFFDILPLTDVDRLKNIIDLAKLKNVELMVHPERPAEYEFLTNEAYLEMVKKINTGSFSDL